MVFQNLQILHQSGYRSNLIEGSGDQLRVLVNPGPHLPDVAGANPVGFYIVGMPGD